MKMKKFKNVLVLLVALMTVVSLFSACGKKDKAVNKTVTDKYKESWVVKPEIEAQAIDPLVRAVFNENTNHYDISFDNCFRIMQNSKYGIIDYNGKIVVKPEYDELFAIRDNRGYIGIKVESDGDKAQTYIHSDTYEKEPAYKKYNSEKFEYYWNGEKLVFVKTQSGDSKEQKGKPSLPEAVKGVVYSGNKFNPDGTFGLYANSKNITGMVYSSAGCFSDSKVAFRSNGKWGYIDSNGRTVIPFEYDAVSGYSALGGDDTPYEGFGGYTTLCKEKKFGVMNNDGKIVVPFKYDDATPVVSGRMFVKSNGMWGILLVDENAEIPETTTSKTKETTTVESTTEKNTEAISEEETSKTESGNSSAYYINDARTLRYSPEYEEDNIILTVDEGVTVTVDRVEGIWGHIYYDGEEGWINLSGLEAAEGE